MAKNPSDLSSGLHAIPNRPWTDYPTGQNLSGKDHVTVIVGDDLTPGSGSISGILGAAVKLFKEPNPVAKRGWGPLPQVVFPAGQAGAYLDIDLGATQDWSAGAGEDDRLEFWMFSKQTWDGTALDVEIRTAADALITGADYALDARTDASRWQRVSIDTASEDLSDVQHIRIINDSNNRIVLYLDSFVRWLLAGFNNTYFKDFELEAEGDHILTGLSIRAANLSQNAHVHIGTPVNDELRLEPNLWLRITMHVPSIYIHDGAAGDTSVNLELEGGSVDK